MYLLRQQGGGSRKYFEAVYFLGVKLFDERLVMEELDRGIGAMKDGIYGLHEMALAAKDDNRAAELQRQGDALSDYFRNTFNRWRPDARSVVGTSRQCIFSCRERGRSGSGGSKPSVEMGG